MGSQNAQDSRYYGEFTEVPVIEPGPWNVWNAVEDAFRASEQFSRVSLLRLTPSLIDGEITPGVMERKDGQGTIARGSLTMKGRVESSRNMLAAMSEWSRQSNLNQISGPEAITGAAEMSEDLSARQENIASSHRISFPGRKFRIYGCAGAGSSLFQGTPGVQPARACGTRALRGPWILPVIL